MKIGFVGGAGVALNRSERWHTVRSGRMANRQGSVVMLFGKKAKVEIPGASDAVSEKEQVMTVEPPPPEQAEQKAPAGFPYGKAFFAFTIFSVIFTLVRNGRGSKKSTQTTASGFSFAKAQQARPRSSSSRSPSVPSGQVAPGWASSQRAVPMKHVFDSQAKDLLQDKNKKYILVGGKGGVGKTSMSAALATKFADSSQTTLIISTDPAHSLSDAFGSDVSGGMPMPVVGIENLYAQEINPEDIKSQINLLSPNEKRAMMPGMMDDMGLDDLDGLFETLPPGFDEAVALVEIIKLIQGDPAYTRFDRIVFDTAPTGHTLRLLALPDFLDSFLGKIISMKAKLGGMMNQMKSMFGGADADGLDTREMDEMKKSMQIVRDLFKDDVQTEFIVATIPNMMAISESTRLIEELRKESIPVHYVFVNQIQAENNDCAFCSTRRKEQQANLNFLEETFNGMKLSKIQFFDREIRGPYALRSMGRQLFQDEENEAEKPEPVTTSSSTSSSTTTASQGSSEAVSDLE